MKKDVGSLPLCMFRSGITTSFGNPCNLEVETCPNLVFYNKLKKILVLSSISGTSLYKRLFHSLVLAGFGLFVSFQTLVKHFFNKCFFNTFIISTFWLKELSVLNHPICKWCQLVLSLSLSLLFLIFPSFFSLL